MRSCSWYSLVQKNPHPTTFWRATPGKLWLKRTRRGKREAPVGHLERGEPGRVEAMYLEVSREEALELAAAVLEAAGLDASALVGYTGV